MTKDKQIYKRAGWLSIFCGVWNKILGGLYGFGFCMAYFDIGWDQYAKTSALFKNIQHLISLIGNSLFILSFICCICLIVGGVMLLSNKRNTRILTFGLFGMYFYFACYGVIAILLSSSEGNFYGLTWVGISLVILIPSFLLHRILSKNL